MATLQQAITIARYITNDTNATGYARPDTTLLQFANDALDAIASPIGRPDLFHAFIDLTCVANKTQQTLDVATSLKLVDVLGVKAGNAITPIERRVLDRFVPGWNVATAAAAEHWMPVDDLRFEIYPPSPTGQILECIHVAKPLEYAAGVAHTLSDAWTPAIADYIVWQLDSLEDEYAVNGRAKMYMDSFYAKLGKPAPQN